MKKRLLAICFVCVLALTGCAGKADHAYTTVIAGESQFNGVFSPFFSTNAYDKHAYQFAFDTLISYDSQGQPAPGLADYTIEEKDDETVYTFHLKQDVNFSDGKPMTAQDLLFNILIYCDPSYDGSSTMSTVDIVGLEEYKNGDADEIAGVRVVDDKTLEVRVNGIDPSAIYKFVFEVAPAHYYGTDDNGNTWVKGDLTVVKSRNDKPMGSGAYVFESFQNNIVTLRANENYWQGAPKTPTIKLQVNSNANKLEAVKQGEIDISSPNANPESVKMAEEAGLYPVMIDNPGYGYIGINADRVPDKNIRKAMMHLMNRAPAIQTYYGDLATIIERPMSTTSWAYPKGAEEFYGFNPEKALEYFKAAGYEQVAENGRTVLKKDGVQFRIEIAIGGEGTMDHPSAPILTQMKTELEKLGGILDITDTDSAILFDKMKAGEWDMFVAAWSATPDPDMYQLYHSEGTTNHYRIKNEELDRLIEAGRSTTDIEERKEIYAQVLDLIMDEAVEMPVYQRMNMIVFNPKVVNTESLIKDATPYRQPFYDNYFSVHTLELN